MGGYLCFEILRLAPERVLRLALVGTTADPERPDVSERRWHMIRKSEDRGFLTMWREFIPRFLHRDLLNNQPLVELLMKQAYEVGHFTFRQHQIAMMKREGYADLLRTISCPTTILVGDDDLLTPVETHQAMADAIPDAKLVVFRKAGHLLSMERPVETAQVFRDWLTDQPLRNAA
jgi:pimeloyl-ACP methyl ester carboxylesterase